LAGAFGAHALQARVTDPKMLEHWKTASQYQLLHSCAACLAATVSTSPTSAALLLGGNLLFSGSLYALVLTGKKKLGAITPIGGLMYILGWLALAFSF
jgi:uncharacterized membrane protein YgdD (TMEM256/DUF423 family)